MYFAAKLTEKLFKQHVGGLLEYRYSFFQSQAAGPIEESFMRTLLFVVPQKPNPALIINNKTGAAVALVIMYQPRKDFNDCLVEILLRKSVIVSISDLVSVLRDVVTRYMKHNKLSRARTFVLDLDRDQIETVEKTGFEKEAALKEEWLFDGKYRDCFIYTLFKDSTC